MTAENPDGGHQPETIGRAPTPPIYPGDAEAKASAEPTTISEVFGRGLSELTDEERALLTGQSWREPSEPPVIRDGEPSASDKRTYFEDPATATPASFYDGFAAIELSDTVSPVQHSPQYATPDEPEIQKPVPAAASTTHASVVEEFGTELADDDPVRAALADFEASFRGPVQAATARQQAPIVEAAPTEPVAEPDFTAVELFHPADVQVSERYRAKYGVFQQYFQQYLDGVRKRVEDDEAARLAAIQATRQVGDLHHSQPNGELSPLALRHRAAGMSEQIAALMGERLRREHTVPVLLSPAVQSEQPQPSRTPIAMPLRRRPALATPVIGGGELTTVPVPEGLPHGRTPKAEAWDWFTPKMPLEPGAMQQTVNRDGKPVFEGRLPALRALEAAASEQPEPATAPGMPDAEPPTLRTEQDAFAQEPATVRLPHPAAGAPTHEWPAAEPAEDGTMVKPPKPGNQATVYFSPVGHFNQDVKPSNEG